MKPVTGNFAPAMDSKALCFLYAYPAQFTAAAYVLGLLAGRPPEAHRLA